MPDEWSAEELFDDDYLHFYLPRLTDETSDAETETIWSLLSLVIGADVLDLACGHGRISNRLAAKGARVTGIDATPLFLGLARREASERGVEVDYVEGDMRTLPWADDFDAIVSWFTAFGYFDDAQNKGVLREAHKALRSGGRFLVELNHKDGLLPHWAPSTVLRVDDSMLIDEREFDPVTGRSSCWRTIVRDGAARRTFYFTRLFGYTELRDWLLEAGFRSVEGFAGDGGPLTRHSVRMILVGTK
jgi:SAM-dependent methyltransferase